MNQLTLNIPQIDEEATKLKAEKLLDQYRLYLLQVPDDFLPKVTPTYSIVPPSITNEFHSSTEDAALKRLDWEIQRDKFLKGFKELLTGFLKENGRSLSCSICSRKKCMIMKCMQKWT